MTVDADKQLERMSTAQLKQRIELNRKARFGLETATPDQLNIIYMICQHLSLDPLEDITLMHGHPWYTVHGTFRMMRRHPEYAGFRQWPLTKDDKLTGGWAETDIVWATEIKTKSWGSIVQWGKVTTEEIMEGQRRKTPIGTNYVEMAQKRSAQHAIRAAFGHEAAPDESQIEAMMVEEIAKRQDPARTKQLSDRYTQIYGTDDEPPKPAMQRVMPPSEAEEVRAAAEYEEQLTLARAEAEVGVTEEDEGDEVDEEQSMLSRAWARNRQLSEQAARLRLRPRILNNRSTVEEIEHANNDLESRIQQHTTVKGAPDAA